MRARARLAIGLTAALLGGCTIDGVTFTPLADGGGDDFDGSAGLDGPRRDGGADAALVDAGPTTIELVASATDLAVEESDTATFTVRLSNPPAGPLLVTLVSSDDDVVTVAPAFLLFSDGDWDEAQTVTLSAQEDDDIADEDITVEVASNDVELPVTVAVAVADNDDLAVVVSPAGTLEVSEGSTATLAVELSANPGLTVVVGVASSNPAVTLSAASLTFTTASWDSAQNLIVTGVQDANTVDGAATLTLTSSLTDDETVVVTVIDDDVLGIQPSSTNLGTLTEGTGTSFTVTLTQQPAGPVTVAVDSSDGEAATGLPASLAFTTTDWDTPQTVTVSAPHDDDTGDASAQLTLSATGLADRTVAIAIDDDDTQAIVVTPNPLSIDENGMTTCGVHLAFAPAAPLTVSISSLNGAVATANQTELTFTAANYATDQPLIVSALDDLDAAVGATSIRLESLAAGLSTDVPVTVIDDDVLLIETSTSALTVGEAGQMTFGVRLTAQPVGTVSVAVVSGNTQKATVSPTPLSFNAGNYTAYQTVTVSGVADVNLGNESVGITMSSAGLPNAVVAVTVTDDDTQEILLSAASITVLEGGTGTIGVSLRYMPSASVSVAAAAVNPSVASVTATPLVFTTANYGTPQNLVIGGVQDADTSNGSTSISLTATSIAPASISVTVTDDDTLTIQTDVTSVNLGEAGTATFGVRLGAMPAAGVTVNVTSGAAGHATVSPPSLAFTTGNYGTYQTVTVTGVADVDLVNDAVTITMTATGLPNKTLTANVADDDSQGILVAGASVTAKTVTEGATGTVAVTLRYQPTTNTAVTVSSASPAVATVMPTPLVFTAGNYNVAQNITITGTQDVNLVAGSTTVSLTATGAASATVNVTVNDDDTQEVLVSQSTVSVAEGGSTTVGVSLRYQPASGVTVALASDDGAVATVAPASGLAFTTANYGTPQDMTIVGVDDVDGHRRP